MSAVRQGTAVKGREDNRGIPLGVLASYGAERAAESLIHAVPGTSKTEGRMSSCAFQSSI